MKKSKTEPQKSSGRCSRKTVVDPSHGEDVFQFWQDRFNENGARFSLRRACGLVVRERPGWHAKHTPDFGPKNVYIFRIRKYESICSRVLRLDQREKSPARIACQKSARTIYSARVCVKYVATALDTYILVHIRYAEKQNKRRVTQEISAWIPLWVSEEKSSPGFVIQRLGLHACAAPQASAFTSESWLEQFSSPELHTVYYKVRFMASGAHSPRSGSSQRHTETQSAWKRPGHRVGGGRLVAWILKRDR